MLSRRFLLAAIASLAVSAISPHLSAEDAPEPDALTIQNWTQRSYAMQENQTLKGQLRKEALEVPLELSLAARNIRFKFFNPAQIINLDINEKGYVLREVVKGSNNPIPAAKYATAVRGTDITYEDLSLRFLYWPNPVKLEDDSVSHRNCWRIRINNPNKTGAYGVAIIWVDKQSGGILQMYGYDFTGKLIKRYKILSGQKVNGNWTLKEMSVETIDPASEGKKVTGRTYLTLDRN